MLAEAATAVDAFNACAAREDWSTMCDEKMVFGSPKLVELRDIWRVVRGRRNAQARRLHGASPWQASAETYLRRMRAGGRQAPLSSGKYLEEVVPEMFIASWIATCDLVIDLRKPLRFLSRFRANHLDHVAAECLVAPLAGEGSEPWGLLVSVVYSPVVV